MPFPSMTFSVSHIIILLLGTFFTCAPSNSGKTHGLNKTWKMLVHEKLWKKTNRFKRLKDSLTTGIKFNRKAISGTIILIDTSFLGIFLFNICQRKLLLKLLIVLTLNMHLFNIVSAHSIYEIFYFEILFTFLLKFPLTQ